VGFNVRSSQFVLATALSVVAMSCAARADVLHFTPGVGGANLAGPLGSNITVETFDELPLGPFTISTGFWAFSGNATIAGPPTTSNTAEPWGDSSQYLSVQAGQSETITFKGPLPTSFGFYWGSVDLYNVVEITYADAAKAQTFTNGSNPPPANGDQFSPSTNGYVLFSGSDPIASVTLSTGDTNAFELDNFFADPTPAPLPAALPLVAGGLGIVGFLSRRKKRKTTIA
jgi:hypothetical protein